MKNLQSIEFNLLNSVQQATLMSREVQAKYEDIMSQGYSKKSLAKKRMGATGTKFNLTSAQGSTENMLPYRPLQKAYNVNGGRPITQSANARRLYSNVDSGKLINSTSADKLGPQTITHDNVNK